jgi:predicted glycoside hydrolase/deacetylase ChbG (UPF0249 family)
MSERRLVICADDYGISPAVSGAIRDLIARRRINATTVMVLSPSFDRSAAAELCDAAATTHAAIGLHVTLTAPFRPLSESYTPLHHGTFLPLAATAGRALARSLRPELLSAEISRQFAAFAEAFSRPPDFVDGHQHVQLLPQVSDALLAVMPQAAPGAWIRQCGRAVPPWRRWGDPKGLLLDVLSVRLHARGAACGIRTNPAFAGTYNFRSAAGYGALFESFLHGLPDGGLVMCHPGFVDAELRRLDPLTDVREQEHAFFAGDGFPALLAANGVALA